MAGPYDEISTLGDENGDTNIPLCVDLDGTLLKSDLLHESVIRFLSARPFAVFVLILALLRGRAALKRFLAEQVGVTPELLPFREDLLEFLRDSRAKGRKLYLVTASDQKFAQHVVTHLGIFEGVLGSDGKKNLKAKVKQRFLVERFGERGFDYIGDSLADIPVWQKARRAYVVGPKRWVASLIRKKIPVSGSFGTRELTLPVWARALRVHQWVKNLLVFTPLVLSHEFTNTELFLDAVTAFFSFSLCASSVYILNDLLDLESDRHHPRKRFRPFAAGELSLLSGAIAVPFLLLTSAILAILLPQEFQLVLLTYFGITLAYSLRLKQIVLIDILVLSGLYTIRLLAGGLATEIVLTHWLLVFSGFFFFSLACVKRFSELFTVRKKERTEIRGRGYQESDLEVVGTLGIGGGLLSVFVLVMYVTSDDVTQLYSNPGRLLLIVPLLLYWTSRVWLLGYRGQMNEDPIVFAIKDQVSYGVLAGMLLLMLFSL
jgi:4-hydroxybenzoate polyprenyltransferase/phosphoserine phosphatase